LGSLGRPVAAPYSLRGWEVPTVSVPVTWDEVDHVAGGGDPATLVFLPDDARRRVAEGDLFAPVLTTEQTLPYSPPASAG
jgi:bifunctional non-homologous end joining protein LigD